MKLIKGGYRDILLKESKMNCPSCDSINLEEVYNGTCLECLECGYVGTVEEFREGPATKIDFKEESEE
jgi:transcription initiation factor TFIIIB Brf1 subunit/transcription initiation factor TFIIB